MTHDELVARGSAWLRRQGCALVFSEYHANTTEKPDCIGWRERASILVECKASRADFLADKTKPFRQSGGMGDFRFYLSPPGIIRADELPIGWGLLYAHPRKIESVAGVPDEWYTRPNEGDKREEVRLLYSALRRLQFRLGQAECDRLIHMTFADREAIA